MAVNWKARCWPNMLQSQRQKLLLLYWARVACMMQGSMNDGGSCGCGFGSGFCWGGLVAWVAFVVIPSLLKNSFGVRW